MSIINLVWTGATDLENEIVGYDLSYKTGTSWIQIPFISTTNGYGSYSFTATQNVTHTFRIRTKDAAQNYSFYKTLIVPFQEVFNISQTSTATNVTACNLNIPNIVIYPASPTLDNGSIIYSNINLSTPINGTSLSFGTGSTILARQWKILTPMQENYTVRINASGVILAKVLCNNNVYNGLLSNGASSGLSACNLVVLSNNPVYWGQSDLTTGVILYTTSSLVTTVTIGYYRIYYSLNGLERDYIIKVNTLGVIITISNYTSYCSLSTVSLNNTNNSNNSTGGGNSCVDPNTNILIDGNTTKLASEILVGDIIYTIHEFTHEYNKYEVSYKEIVVEEKIIVNFSDKTDITVSLSHKFLDKDDKWVEAKMLLVGDTLKGIYNNKIVSSINYIGLGDVVKLQIKDAHTYISNGLISHNKTIVMENP